MQWYITFLSMCFRMGQLLLDKNLPPKKGHIGWNLKNSIHKKSVSFWVVRIFNGHDWTLLLLTVLKGSNFSFPLTIGSGQCESELKIRTDLLKIQTYQNKWLLVHNMFNFTEKSIYLY